jgi:hypothetical protein
MSALRLPAAAAAILLIAPLFAVAADPPGPPQPPLTNATVAEWYEEYNTLDGLQDNTFLYDDAAGELRRKVAAWQGADVVLSLEVQRVTKEAVECGRPATRSTFRNEQEPAVASEDQSSRSNRSSRVALRIGDIVPLELARRLRQSDVVVVKGVVEACGFEPGEAIMLAVAQSQIVATVSCSTPRTLPGLPEPYSESFRRQLRTPHYPTEALAGGAAGQAVVKVGDGKVTLSRSAGNAVLDNAVMSAFDQIRRQGSAFQGEHQFTFTILRR